jgi:AraC-like DNA-binding protein
MVEARAVESVLRAVDLVEERMSEDLGAQDMARAACYSPFYFSRVFAQATGHSPYDYLMRRRVAAAAEEVVGGSRSLTDIALDFGFEVPDSFARAFRRCLGSLPSEARKAGRYPRALARTKVERPYVEAMLVGAIAPPTRIVLGGEVLVGLRPKGLGSSIAADFGSATHEILELDEDGRASERFVGKIAISDSAPAFPLSATRLPSGEAARFRVVRGRDDEALDLELLRDFAYRAWLPTQGLAAAPRVEILELDGATGEPLALVLPLDSKKGEAIEAGLDRT